MTWDSFDTLSDEDLAELAKSNRDAMCVLAARYEPLVFRRAGRFHGKMESEDLAQEGFLGLISAVSHFDGRRGIPFQGFASTCITNRLLSAIRKQGNTPLPGIAVGQLSVPLEEQFIDPFPSPEETAIRRTFLRELLEHLSHQEYQVCVMISDGASYSETASALHCSVKAVDNAMQRVRQKLKTFC